MNIKKLRCLAWLMAGVFLLASCGSPKKYAYLQDVALAKAYAVQHDQKLTIKPGDRLTIAVASSYPELVGPFNGQGFNTAVPGMSSSSAVNTNDQQSQALQAYGYKVSSTGEINFPVLGNIRVEGMTLEQVRDNLTRRIVESKYVPDPRVTVTFANFRVYLLGALPVAKTDPQSGGGSTNILSRFNRIAGASGGVLEIYDQDKVNIFEALSLVGDVPINANIEKLHVIRNEGGKFVTYRINLKKTDDIFSSPAFYLQQHDILYIEPRFRRSELEGVQQVLQITGYAFSTIASVAAVIALLNK